MKTRNKMWGLFVALSTAIVVVACGTSVNGSGGQRGEGIAEISAERIIEHIKYLSSDELEGRGTGEAGGEKAADYIAKAFAEAGLAPAGDDGTFLQGLSVIIGAGLGEKNELFAHLGDTRLAYSMEEDFRPLSFSESGTVSGEVVFAGYGISAESHGYDDYEGIDCEGKIVLVMRHEPAEKDEDSPFDGTSLTHYSELRYKAMNAREHGAAAMVLFTDPLNHPDERDSLLEFDPREGRSSVGIPCVQLSAAQAEEVIRETGNDISELQARIDRELRPQSFPLADVRITMAVEISRESRRASNVLGLLAGSDPVLSAERVVVGAHYDHLGRKGEDIYHGADDNASGTAALLELARVFSSGDARPARSILFAAFTGEELGLLGSSYLVGTLLGAPEIRSGVVSSGGGARGVDHSAHAEETPHGGEAQDSRADADSRKAPTDYAGGGAGPAGDAAGPATASPPSVAMVNLDMVGRLRDEKVYIGGAESSPIFRPLLDELGEEHGLDLEYSESAYGASDHTAFYAKNSPVLMFFTGAHTDHHKPSDTWEKINTEGEVRIVSLVADVILSLAFDPDPISFTRAPSKAGSPHRGEGYGGYSRAYLGIVPDFSGGGEGVKLAGVSEGSPAEAAGLKGGDVMVSFDGRAVKDLRDLSYLLKEKKAGDTVEIVVLRDGEKLALQTVLRSR